MIILTTKEPEVEEIMKSIFLESVKMKQWRKIGTFKIALLLILVIESCFMRSAGNDHY